MAAILKITDGTTEIVLTQSARAATASGLHRATLDQGWLPKVAEYKAGGIWQDSPLSDNRTLATTQFQNVVETFRLNLRDAATSLYPTGTSNASAQDLMIRVLQEIRRLLEKAASYWTTSWQDEPVYLVAQAEYETSARYAILYRGAIPEDKDPYFKLFERVGDPMMLALDCIVERGHWTASAPGTGVCVEASSWYNWAYEGEWALNTTLPTSDVWGIVQADNGYLFIIEAGTNILRSIDNGVNWAVNFAGIVTIGRDLFAAVNGSLYAADTGGFIYRSTNYGGAWPAVLNTGAIAVYSLGEGANGYIYAGGTARIWRSIDNGTTWTATAFVAGANCTAIWGASNGYIFAGIGTGGRTQIWRSIDNGTTWQVSTNLPIGPVDSIIEVGGRILASDQLGIIASDDWGVTWYVIATSVNFHVPAATAFHAGAVVHDMVVGVDGYLYAVGSIGAGAAAVVAVWRTMDRGNSWDTLIQLTGGVGVIGRAIAQATYTDSRFYIGSVDVAAEEVWRTGLTAPMGRSRTCLDEVYVANKENTANLTHIKTYVNATTTYADIYPMSSLPTAFLPAAPVLNDAVYFGIDTSLIPSGPFCSLVFDIQTPMTAAAPYTITWEYYNTAAAWTTLLNVADNTNRGAGVFAQFGVNSVHWSPPVDWATFAVNGVTAWWVRARVSAWAGALTAPIQQNRSIYSVVKNGIHIDDAQVPGDIPALLRFKFHNQSSLDSDILSDVVLDNRVIAGLRSVNRGDDFTAFINCAQEQNPVGIAVIAGTGTAFGDESGAPTGRSAVHSTQGNGLTNYDTALTIDFFDSIANEFYGTYHVYLRAQLYDPDPDVVAPVGDHDDVRVRLQVRSGSGGVTYTTGYRQFIGWDKWDNTLPAPGEEERYKDWQLLDFGQINIPVTGILKSTELPDETAIVIQIASAASTELRVDLYDVVLIPVDEWSGDFVDNALEDDSGVAYRYLLDVDSLAYPKRDIRSLVRTANVVERMRAVYQPITNGPAVLQANADQKLWFLAARGIYQGEHDGGDAHAHLHDSHADFIDAGVQVGMTVENVTANQTMVVTQIVSATQLNGTLTGADTWDDDDVYYIICPCWRSEPWNAHSIQLTGNSRYLSMRGDR